MALPEKETLSIEFKSDRNRLSDDELVEAVVALANTQGGELYIGVEDDGSPTGLHPAHQNAIRLAAMVGNRTRPSLSVRTEVITIGTVRVARVQVDRISASLVATQSGKVLRRRLTHDGSPEIIPIYPYEMPRMLANMGGFDASEQPVSNATTADLDPLERERLRQIITKYNGDGSLLQLSDDELDGALGLTIDFGGGAIPTVTGLLLIGREESLRKMIPAHEVLFQVLAGTSVRMNDGFRAPLLKVFETLLERFRARNNEQEIDEGMFRVPVPDYDERAFREALVNALAHRDYMLLGAVHVQMTDEGLSISSPGGFIEGVTVENLLYTAPRSRNPRLADALKRVGLAERTGRGVDRIYQGMLRYGRPEPDYSTSTTTTVTVTMQYTRADTAFFRLILNAEQQIGGPMPVDDLLVLSYLREARKLTADVIAAHLHKSETAIRAILTRLIERGLVEAHGTSRGQGRTYTLSAMVYRAAGQQSEYVRQVGFDHIQQEQMVLKYVKAHGHISRREVMELCQLGEDQAYRVLRRLSEEGKLVRIGFTKSAIYILSE